MRRDGAQSGVMREMSDGPMRYSAFIPAPLPPVPALKIDPDLQLLIDSANQSLGRLDALALLLPDPDLFIYSYVRKEAVLSSQIEGTVSSLSDLLLFEADEAPGVPIDDVVETSNYLTALKYGLKKIETGEMPLCNRLLREMHKLLLDSGRGANKTPGRFRREPNWLGGASPAEARFVPPPWQEIEGLMAQLERFIHDEGIGPTPTLIKAALAHVQFETIHPFLDGNGRVGRLLITLLLAAEGVLKQPLLYLSLYLKQNRDDYYDHLQRTRTEGDWEGWLRFFVQGVDDVARGATQTTKGLISLIDRDRKTVQGYGRGALTATRLHDLAARKVVLRPRAAAEALGLSGPPVYQAIQRLEADGILREVTGRRRGRLYVYDEYLRRLNEGTESPATG